MHQAATIMIVEDQVFVGEDLKDRLSQYNVLGPFGNGETALEAPVPDLAILDIHLDGELTGLDIAEKLNEQATVPIIFLTRVQDDQTIFNRVSNYTFPCAYLSKPVSNNALMISIQNALKTSAAESTEQAAVPVKTTSEAEEHLSVVPGKVLVRNGNAQYSINIDEHIIYLEADGETTKIYSTLQQHPMVVSTHLKNLLARIADHSDSIVRTSRSHAVNIYKLRQITDAPRNLSKIKTLVLEGTDFEVTLSVRYRDKLVKRFHSL